MKVNKKLKANQTLKIVHRKLKNYNDLQEAVILQGIYVVSWSSGFLRRNQNHADSYTDNFQFQEFLSGKEKTN